jgi:hypothetical protein
MAVFEWLLSARMLHLGEPLQSRNISATSDSLERAIKVSPQKWNASSFADNVS